MVTSKKDVVDRAGQESSVKLLEIKFSKLKSSHINIACYGGNTGKNLWPKHQT